MPLNQVTVMRRMLNEVRLRRRQAAYSRPLHPARAPYRFNPQFGASHHVLGPPPLRRRTSALTRPHSARPGGGGRDAGQSEPIATDMPGNDTGGDATGESRQPEGMDAGGDAAAEHHADQMGQGDQPAAESEHRASENSDVGS